MEWLSVEVDTAHEGVDAVCARLSALEVETLAIQDEAEFRAFLEADRRPWELVDDALRRRLAGVCRVGFYLPADGDGRRALARVRAGLEALRADAPGVDLGTLAVRVETVRDEDWAESWKQFYKPVPVGRRLLIQPAWEPADATEGRAVFLNNPGMSFGTGEHETTFLCLEALERRVRGGERLLDLGCGSGILAICALLLGAAQADAIDIDPHAVRTARENAARNGFAEPRFRAAAGDPLSGTAPPAPPYDLVTANIVADVVIALCPPVSGWLRAGGLFVISGVIGARLAEVRAAAQNAGFVLDEARALRDWHCLTVRKP
ncbi:MAG: 50S ribosomal protein L11 methyltransferase [Oscillospiraceae bacterium]|nr:50S ribosomal protein L11 methyltransferase [Oscillospiraceae bacterium]